MSAALPVRIASSAAQAIAEPAEWWAANRHELHPATHFRTDAIRFGMCKLFGYRSAFGNADWSAVISAFKTTTATDVPTEVLLKRLPMRPERNFSAYLPSDRATASPSQYVPA